MKKYSIPAVVVVSGAVVLFILSRFFFFYPVRTTAIRTGASEERIHAVFGPGRLLQCPDTVLVKPGRLIIKDEDGTTIKQFKTDGSFISSFILSNSQGPCETGTIGVDRSGNLYAEVVSGEDETSDTNAPRGSTALLRFDVRGKLMKTVSLFDGRLAGISFNEYNYMTVIARDNTGRFRVERYDNDTAVLGVVFSNESPGPETGLRYQLTAVLTADNDGQAILEFKCYDGKKGGYLYTKLMAFDLIQKKFLPDLFSFNDEAAELLASDTANRLYFTTMAGRGLLRLTIRDLHGKVLRNKYWDAGFRNLSGFLLFPFIVPDGSICQARVNSRFFRVIWYR